MSTYGPKEKIGHPKTSPTNPIFQKVKQTFGVRLSQKNVCRSYVRYTKENLTSNIDHPNEENLDDFSNIVFNDLKEKTNDTEEFDGEFVNLEEINIRSRVRKKRGRQFDGGATSSVENNDDNDVDYQSGKLDSGQSQMGKIMQF